MCIFLSSGFFPTLFKSSLKALYKLTIEFKWSLYIPGFGRDMLLTGSSGCFWTISIPIRGKLSFPRMFLSCPVVIINGVSSEIYPLDCFLTKIFLIILIVSLVKPQCSAPIFSSTGRIFSVV